MKLVLAQDGTYLGCIIAENGELVTIEWFKWGFAGETFRTVEAPDKLLALSHADCIRRFGGLPPNNTGGNDIARG